MSLENLLRKITLSSALAISTLFGCVNKESNYKLQDTLVNRFVSVFDENLPTSPYVVKKFTPSAKRCLIHVRQLHYHDYTNFSESERIKKNQKEIYSILDFITKNFEIKEVYNEGITRDEEEKTNEEISSLKNLLEKDRFDTDTLSYIFHNGKTFCFDYATFKIALEENVRIKASEEKELNEQGIKKVKMFFGLPVLFHDKEIFDKREDALLKILSENGKEIALVVYGGAHDWRNNITNWNKNHEDKFSMIEITPKSYINARPFSRRN